MKLKIEQSNTKFYTPVAGLYFIGHTINKQIPLWKTQQKIKKKHGIANIDFIPTCSGLPAQKRGCFDIANNYRTGSGAQWASRCHRPVD